MRYIFILYMLLNADINDFLYKLGQRLLCLTFRNPRRQELLSSLLTTLTRQYLYYMRIFWLCCQELLSSLAREATKWIDLMLKSFWPTTQSTVNLQTKDAAYFFGKQNRILAGLTTYNCTKLQLCYSTMVYLRRPNRCCYNYLLPLL